MVESQCKFYPVFLTSHLFQYMYTICISARLNHLQKGSKENKKRNIAKDVVLVASRVPLTTLSCYCILTTFYNAEMRCNVHTYGNSSWGLMRLQSADSTIVSQYPGLFVAGHSFVVELFVKTDWYEIGAYSSI